MAEGDRNGWRRRLGLASSLAPLAGGIFVFGLGQELWSRDLPEYLRFLGRLGAMTIGAFGALQDLLDAAYAYPGGWLSDRPRQSSFDASRACRHSLGGMGVAVTACCVD
jgi:hypothetical protein